MKNGPLFLLGLFVALVDFVRRRGAGLACAAWVVDALFRRHGRAGAFRNAPPASRRAASWFTRISVARRATRSRCRRPDYGSDQARGWGERQSVARDYIHQARPQLGDSRLGPDLTNYGARVPKESRLRSDGADLQTALRRLGDASELQVPVRGAEDRRRSRPRSRVPA